LVAVSQVVGDNYAVRGGRSQGALRVVGSGVGHLLDDAFGRRVEDLQGAAS
jgi:hypothetical protein